jgi:1-acyl-sn-glycerol-3-phosphate acyltransferase
VNTPHTAPDRSQAAERRDAPVARRPTVFYLLLGVVSWPVVRLLYRTRWTGRANVPRTGGAVLGCNHVSSFDPWPLGLGIFPGRYLRFMAKLELFRPPLGSLLRASGCFPVDRSRPDRDALATAVALCRRGEVVVMFPEGTRRAKGLRKRFEAQPHTGAARIALRAGVPLIPAAVRGTDRLARFGRLEVAYGPPLELDGLASLPRREAAEVATQRLMTAIAELERSLSSPAR